MDYLLDDITVLDAASFLAGPGAATILADFGANVIKIEPPGGDGYRQLVGTYPVPYHWQLTSRNKRSLVLDLTTEAGQAVLHQLVKQADVITTNFLQPTLERYQMDYQCLKEINPRLIFAHLTGYGTKGIETARRAFDLTAWWARSGMMEYVRDVDQVPLGPAPGMGDHATATALFGAIMTGLYRRSKTGEGSLVSTSLLANGVWANGMALQGVIAGNDVSKIRREKGFISPFTGTYRTRDGDYLVLAIINVEKEWPRLCRALNHQDWLQDPRFSEHRTLMRNRYELMDLINEIMGRLSIEQACALLDEHDITYGPVQQMSAVLTDQQMLDNGIVVPTNDAEEDYKLTIGSPINIDESPKKPPQRAPEIGADSTAVLLEMGFSEQDIQGLISRGVVLQRA
ncbi:MAG: CoA transferase [Pseudomonadales bacterium]|nr:CoA transferase [Pseudomonadales bacterium]